MSLTELQAALFCGAVYLLLSGIFLLDPMRLYAACIPFGIIAALALSNVRTKEKH